MKPRYAIYFAPAHGSPWWAFGARWLGRDEQGDSALAQPPLTQIAPEELHEITAQPRRYGFHATLKAPFKPGQCVRQGFILRLWKKLSEHLL